MEKAKIIFNKAIKIFHSPERIGIAAAGAVVIIAAAVWFGFKSSEPDAEEPKDRGWRRQSPIR